MDDYKTFSEYELEKEDTIHLFIRTVFKPFFLIRKWTSSIMKINLCSVKTIKDIKAEIERQESQYRCG